MFAKVPTACMSQRITIARKLRTGEHAFIGFKIVLKLFEVDFVILRTSHIL